MYGLALVKFKFHFHLSLLIQLDSILFLAYNDSCFIEVSSSDFGTVLSDYLQPEAKYIVHIRMILVYYMNLTLHDDKKLKILIQLI